MSTRTPLPRVLRHLSQLGEVVQGDDGRYRLGLADHGPGFESRTFAASVLAQDEPEPDPPDKPKTRRAATRARWRTQNRTFGWSGTPQRYATIPALASQRVAS